MLDIRNGALIMHDKDDDHEVQIVVSGNNKVYEHDIYVNRDQAIDIISHLKEQFGL